MKFNFNTDYNQFYLCDKEAKGETDSAHFWTDEAFNDRLAVEEGILGILIGNEEGTVNGELIVLDSKNNLNEFDSFDHIVEASLEINSGYIQIIDCPFSTIEVELEIEKGFYRARIYSISLESAFTSKPKDYYRIELWKEEFNERVVLKKYNA